jgi:hypothetical protein
MEELALLIIMDVIKGWFACPLSKEQKSVWYYMFLKEERCGHFQGQGCANGHKQQLFSKRRDIIAHC